MPKAPQRNRAIQHILVPKHHRAIVRDVARVKRARALEVVVERGRGARAARDREREAARGRVRAEEELCEREAALFARVELLDDRICVCKGP